MGGPDQYLADYLNHILFNFFLISVRKEIRTLGLPACWSDVTLSLSASFSTALTFSSLLFPLSSDELLKASGSVTMRLFNPVKEG